MDIKNYSVELTVCENGKYNKGTLTLLIDEYVFGKTRPTVDWEKTTCEQGITKVKSFLFSSDKPYVVFKYNGTESQQFILEQANMDTLLAKIEGYANHIKTERQEKIAQKKRAEEEKRKAEEEKQQQEEREKQIREEAKRKAEEELRLKKEDEERRKQEEKRKEKELFDRKNSEKQARIKKEVENCKNAPSSPILLDATIKKVASCFLDNPYRILGVSCVSSNEDANQALDKLKKLARLKALESYKSPYDLALLERPARDLSIAQNALSMLKDKTHKWFWFAEEDACYAWNSGK